MTLLTAMFEGRAIVYNDKTEFLVEVGKGQSAYRPRFRYVGSLAQAVQYYKQVVVSKGWKKRLVMGAPPGGERMVLAREIVEE